MTAEPLPPEQRAHDVATFLNLVADDGIAQRVIAAAIRAAVEAERARCAKEAAGTALREFYRLPFSQFALAEQVSAAAANAINPDATPTTEAGNAR